VLRHSRGEVVAAELEHRRGHRRDHGGRPRLTREERHLADHVSAAEPSDDARPIGLGRQRHPREPIHDQEQAVARLAGPAHDLLRVERPRPEARFQVGEGLAPEAVEQRITRERGRH
jgi:hypothetical protein